MHFRRGCVQNGASGGAETTQLLLGDSAGGLQREFQQLSDEWCGNFDIVCDHFAHFPSASQHHMHAVWHALLFLMEWGGGNPLKEKNEVLNNSLGRLSVGLLERSHAIKKG